jgi:hypothetical protein
MEPRYVPHLRTKYRQPRKAYLSRFCILLRLVVFTISVVIFISGAAVKFYNALESTGIQKAVQLINECIDSSVLSASAKYPENSFFAVEKTNKGGVAAIETSAKNINNYTACVYDSILNEISKKQNQKIEVSVKELAGKGFLVPSGLSIPIKIEPVGTIIIKPESVIEYNEMNKAVHRLNMKVNIRVKIFFPFISREEEIIRDILISEIIIV